MKVSIFALIPLVLSIGIVPAFADHHGGMSPYQQIKNGVEADEVVCKSGLSLMIRQHNVPACVKESSVQELAERYAWGFVAPKPNLPDAVEEVEVVEEIEISEEVADSSEEESTEGNAISVELEETIALKGN